jgi:hypothetical protein
VGNKLRRGIHNRILTPLQKRPCLLSDSLEQKFHIIDSALNLQSSFYLIAMNTQEINSVL